MNTPQNNRSSKLLTEKLTIQAMIRIYCHDQHEVSAVNLCDPCEKLLKYTRERLDQCIFGGEKPTCAQCPVHCYRRDMKETIISVMRYSGPKMLFAHPLLAVKHMLKTNKKVSADVRLIKNRTKR